MLTSHLDVPHEGRTFRRGAPGYEERRRATMWNARVPDRYPEVIVQARTERDVVAAVKLARREGLRIGVRSGGHSWAGNHLRDGGLLLDVSGLDEVTIDRKARRATTGPGRAGNELAEMLGRHSLFFPTGHCKGVCVGGYLLQGGFGWHGRALGPACMSVIGLDLVTADGERVYASAEENADLYWAARGSGPGFFCVVTRFHLRVYEKPEVTGFAFQSFPMSRMEDVFRWARAVGPSVPASVELQLVMTRNATGVGGPGIEVFAPVFAGTARETFDALAFMNESALGPSAALKADFIPATLPLLYSAVMHHYPDDHRYAVDNMWTHAPIDDLLPGLRKIAETLPPPPSHVLWLNWAPPPDRPDMAFSVEDDIYIALYAGWRREKDDDLYASWAGDRMREMQPLASGCQLADENLGKRPARFVTSENLARLDRIRGDRDPKHSFHAWMGRP
ncbi:FAD-binding oxidoreductase [Polyangium fumosum]|uniref:FAD-binding oxidoreductase n=1 Tax=Polyangium fumosum TaxID=889272 RepID=A0A4U1J364_9BACT|nr:FAD-binding oxidoreductase [Polyangium fumosum]TKD01547.1 FAD-binding oxidoreductase [Polyangium fumosum]